MEPIRTATRSRQKQSHRDSQRGLLTPDDASLLTTDTSYKSGGRQGRTKPKRKWPMIDWFPILVVVVGTIAIILTLIVLCFLWRQSNSLHPERFWSQISADDWTTRVITICSTVLRVAISSQIVLACSMIASILLVRNEILYADAAQMAIARVSTDGPSSIILPTLRSRTNRRETWPPVYHIVGMLLLLSGLFQFTSTILVSDLRRQDLLEKPITFNISYRRSNRFQYVGGMRMSGRYLDEYPIFAEKPGDAKSIVSDQRGTGGVEYTGNTTRALLPFAKSNSSAFISYKGPASIISAQVLCFSPLIENFVVNMDGHPNKSGSGNRSAIIAGNLSTPILADPAMATLPGNSFNGFRDFTGINFSSDIPFHLDDVTDRLFFSLTKLEGPKLDIHEQETANASDRHIANPSNTWVLIFETAKGTANDWRVANFSSTPRTIYNAGRHEWVSLYDDNQDGVILRCTVCVHSFVKTLDRRITAKGEKRYTKPELRRNTTDFNHYPFDTDEIRKYFGLLEPKLSLRDRGVLDLTDIEDEDLGTATANGTRLILEPEGDGVSVTTCNTCPDTTSKFHHVLSRIFIDTVSTTNSVGLGLRALMTTTAIMDYYDRMLYFDIQDNATTQSLKNVIAPQRIIGLSVIIGAITVHLTLLSLCCYLFFQDPQNSIGRAWQTVAQLKQGDTGGVLDKVSDVDDNAVRDLIYSKDEEANIHETAKFTTDGTGQISITPGPPAKSTTLGKFVDKSMRFYERLPHPFAFRNSETREYMYVS